MCGCGQGWGRRGGERRGAGSREGFHTVKQFSNPSWASTVQLHSDTDTDSIRSHRLGAQSHRTASLLVLVTSLGSPGYAHCPSWLQIQGVPQPPLPGLNNSLEWLRELGKVFYLGYWFIMKDATQDQPNGSDA